jgi:hypothetical protein
VLGRLQGLLSATTAVGALVGSIATGLLIDLVDVKVSLNVQAALYAVAGLATYLVVVDHRARE